MNATATPAKINRVRITLAAAFTCAVVFGWLAFRAVQHVRLRRPLIDAVKRNDLKAVRSLLNAGADPNARDVPAPSLSLADFWQAIAHQRDAPGSVAATALQLAAVAKENEIARLLVTHGANVNAASSYWPDVSATVVETVYPPGSPQPDIATGYTALMDACMNRDSELTKLLLERGANPNSHPQNEDPPLILVLSGRGFDYIEFSDPDMNIHHSSTEAIVQMLLEHRARAAGQDAVRAAMNYDWPCVPTLLRHGADVNARSNDPIGRTLTIEAAAVNDAATIAFLADHGADLNATDKQKRTALMELCHQYTGELSIDALKTLLEHGANPNLQDNQGNTPLMEAAGVGKKDTFSMGSDMEAIQLLLHHGADATLKDKAGRTVLQKLPAPGPNDAYGQGAWNALASAVTTQERGRR